VLGQTSTPPIGWREVKGENTICHLCPDCYDLFLDFLEGKKVESIKVQPL